MSDPKLNDVLARIDAAVAAGSLPLVIFDLDGTLLDNRTRTMRILREFSAAQGSNFGSLVDVIAGMTADDLGYDARDALRERGFDEPDAFAAFFAFWSERFFTDEYVFDDRETPGACAFANACWDRGAYLYYLTGRHAGGMEIGTSRSLKELGFPMYGGRSSLHLKPSFEVPDAEFKDSAIAMINSLQGTVVASFENEPGHANLLAVSFPGALSFLLDTGHSKSAPPPLPDLVHVPDFRV